MFRLDAFGFSTNIWSNFRVFPSPAVARTPSCGGAPKLFEANASRHHSAMAFSSRAIASATGNGAETKCEEMAAGAA